MACTQLTIPFFPDMSPGTTLYYNKYLKRYFEMCGGGLMFEFGEKTNCRECASRCLGCIEMAVNFGFSAFEDVAHLVTRPKLLKPEYRRKLKILEKNNSKNTKNYGAKQISG
jgi:hypothetical protein